MRSKRFLFESEDKSELKELYDLVTPPPEMKHRNSIYFLEDYLRYNLLDSSSYKDGAKLHVIMNFVRGRSFQEVRNQAVVTAVIDPKNDSFSDKSLLSKAKKIIPEAFSEVKRFEEGKTKEEESKVVVMLIDASRATSDVARSGKGIAPPWSFSSLLDYALRTDPNVEKEETILTIQRGVIDAFLKKKKKKYLPKQ